MMRLRFNVGSDDMQTRLRWLAQISTGTGVAPWTTEASGEEEWTDTPERLAFAVFTDYAPLAERVVIWGPVPADALPLELTRWHEGEVFYPSDVDDMDDI